MRFFFFLFCLVCTQLNAQGTPNNTDPKVISGTVLLNSKLVPNFQKILSELPKSWYVRTDSTNISEKTAVVSTPGATIMLAYLDYPAPPDDLQIAAGISWLWKNAVKEVTAHKAQLVISVLGDPVNTVELYRIFTRAAACVLSNMDNASGIFMNTQFLLISKGYYLEAARNMGREGVPLYCWAYFGLLETDGKSSCYTYGLTEFGLLELELVNSTLPLQDAHGLLFELAQKAVLDKTWKDGQVIELTEGKKVKVTTSAAQLIRDGSQTTKVEIIK